MVRAAGASAALAWNCALGLHFWPALNVGWVLLSILVASLTNPNALAVGSLGSSGGSAATAGVPDKRLKVRDNPPAMKTPFWMGRPGIFLFIDASPPNVKMRDTFAPF